MTKYNTLQKMIKVIPGTEKNGTAHFVYIPENYPGPIAMNATVSKEKECESKSSYR